MGYRAGQGGSSSWWRQRQQERRSAMGGRIRISAGVLLAAIAVGIVAAWLAAGYVERRYPLVELVGKVDDCGCSANDVVAANEVALNPVMAEVEELRFFQYFQVNYWRECQLWEDDYECVLDAGGMSPCHVCTCDMDEIPDVWKYEEAADDDDRTALADATAAAGDVVDTRGSPPLGGREAATDDLSQLWVLHDDSEEFINVKLNPERNTGYVGEEASRIWRAIYEENCFTGPLDEQCLEERVFYRLISGLQASIACHVADRFYILDRPDMESGSDGWQQWRFAANLGLFSRQVGRHRDRVQNMLFVWMFLLRAVEQAKPILLAEDFHYRTGEAEEERQTKQVVARVYDAMESFSCSEATVEGSEPGSCGFDERTMFTSTDKAHLEAEFRAKFRNVSAIMDCVMCQNCRIHGKMSTLGLATALKILLDIRPTAEGASLANKQQLLTRNEVVALFQTFYKFTKAVHIFSSMQQRVQWKAMGYAALAGCSATLLVLLLATALQWASRRRKAARPPAKAQAKQKKTQ